MESELKNERVNVKSSIITRSVEQNINYNTISSRFSLRSNSLETIYAFDNPTFLPDGLPSTQGSEYAIPPLPNAPQYTHYDPYDFGNDRHPSTFWGTIFHIAIISAGPAILTLPKHFQYISLVPGFLVAFLIVCLYAYNMHMFVSAEYDICMMKKIPNLSYSDTVYYAFLNGPKCMRNSASFCRYLTYIVFIVLWMGGDAFNLVLIGENVQTIYSMYCNEHIDVRVAILYSAIPLLLLCWIPNLKYLEVVSTVASILNYFIILTVVFYVFNDNAPFHPPTTTNGIQSIPLFIGSILFCVNATGLIIPLKNAMSQPRKFNSTFGVITVSYIPVGIIYAIFGSLCAQKYGNHLKSNIIMNFPHDNILKIIIPMFILIVGLQFPVITYVAHDILWNNILKKQRHLINRPLFTEYVVRTLIVLIVFIMACSVPNISLFLSLSGTVGCSLDSLIFPALVDVLIHFSKRKKDSKFYFILCKDCLIIVFAIVLTILGIKDCFQEILNTFNK